MTPFGDMEPQRDIWHHTKWWQSDGWLWAGIFLRETLTFLCKSKIVEYLGAAVKHRFANLDVAKFGAPLYMNEHNCRPSPKLYAGNGKQHHRWEGHHDRIYEKEGWRVGERQDWSVQGWILHRSKWRPFCCGHNLDGLVQNSYQNR